MKLPKINLKELKKDIEQNEKERLEFIDRYVEWLKKTPNKKGPRSMLNSCLDRDNWLDHVFASPRKAYTARTN